MSFFTTTSSSPFSRFPMAEGPKEPLPVPITTGISLSERFKSVIQQPSRPQHTLAQGGFGYGGPLERRDMMVDYGHQQSFNHSGFNNNFNSGFNNNSNSGMSQNQMLAAALARRSNALLLQRKLLGSRPPVRNRIGLNNFQSRLPITRGVLRTSVHGAHQFQSRNGFTQQNNGIQGRVVARGGGGGRGPRKGRGGGGGGARRGGSGVSPMNKGAGNGVIGSKSIWFGAEKSKVDLDKELDAYMAQVKKTAKGINSAKSELDAELEEYMKERAKASLFDTASTATASIPQVQTASHHQDITMTED